MLALTNIFLLCGSARLLAVHVQLGWPLASCPLIEILFVKIVRERFLTIYINNQLEWIQEVQFEGNCQIRRREETCQRYAISGYTKNKWSASGVLTASDYWICNLVAMSSLIVVILFDYIVRAFWFTSFVNIFY